MPAFFLSFFLSWLARRNRRYCMLSQRLDDASLLPPPEVDPCLEVLFSRTTFRREWRFPNETCFGCYGFRFFVILIFFLLFFFVVFSSVVFSFFSLRNVRNILILRLTGHRTHTHTHCTIG